jgi:hypothetical protein
LSKELNCVVYCNFGDSYWVTQNFSYLNDSGFFKHFTVIDQNTLPGAKSVELGSSDFQKPAQIKIIPNLNSPYQHASYQHADAVNKVLGQLECSCERIWVIDTDLFVSPRAVKWLDLAMDSYGAIFMQDPVQALFSHPCLFIVDRTNLNLVNLLPTEISLIDPYQTKTRLIDTGRILAAKLSEAGIKVAIVRRNLERTYNPRIWRSIHHPDFYLDGEIVHFRSMSFSTRTDAKQRLRIMDQVRYFFPRRFVEEIIKKKPESFAGLFSLFALKRIGFYAELLFSSRLRSRNSTHK